MNIKQTLVLSMVAVFSLALAVFSPTVVNAAESCGGVETAIVSCSGTDGIWGVLNLVVNILTAGIGVVAVGGIVYGSILYTTAGGSPEQVKKAFGIIRNVIIGLVAYLGMFAFLQFLIPGGVF